MSGYRSLALSGSCLTGDGAKASEARHTPTGGTWSLPRHSGRYRGVRRIHPLNARRSCAKSVEVRIRTASHAVR